ncbi:hypothetical protein CXB51_005436 [Gossypium anomalum]|uniref:Uncharacterized protein n=1 Tax=Gossypium anomalum TaxID=47600 RepID=A0A8J5ZMJ2_9ROSI|nr:hypothetical protein CXB51_005436 [Gossypium anomalum]
MEITPKTSISQTPTKSPQYYALLLLFLLLLLIMISPLFAYHRQPSLQQSSPTNFNSFPTSAATPAVTGPPQFKAAAHEVPSGPNPESNK